MRLEDYNPSPPAEVSCVVEEGSSVLRFVREMRHNPSQVWSVLVEAEKLRGWAPYVPDRDLGAVGPVTLRMIDGSEPEIYESEVYEVTAEQVLSYSWGTSGILTWRLEPNGEGSRLSLHHRMENPEWVVPAAAGWHICLDFAEILLDGFALGPLVGEAVMQHGWRELADIYRSVLGG